MRGGWFQYENYNGLEKKYTSFNLIISTVWQCVILKLYISGYYSGNKYKTDYTQVTTHVW